MRTSLIINTAALAPHAATTRNPHRQNPYAARADLVEIIVDECWKDYDEVIVAGNYKPDSAEPPRYTYLEVSPMYGDRRDALMQREMGARLSTGEVMCFTHDDHLPEFGAEDIPEGDWDILVPAREHGVTGEHLPNGQEQGYMGGHTLLMRRHVWVSIPWLSVITHRCWDLPMTQIWKQSNVKIVFTDDINCVDLEAEEDEG